MTNKTSEISRGFVVVFQFEINVTQVVGQQFGFERTRVVVVHFKLAVGQQGVLEPAQPEKRFGFPKQGFVAVAEVFAVAQTFVEHAQGFFVLAVVEQFQSAVKSGFLVFGTGGHAGTSHGRNGVVEAVGAQVGIEQEFVQFFDARRSGIFFLVACHGIADGFVGVAYFVAQFDVLIQGIFL